MDKNYFIVRYYSENNMVYKRKICRGDVETILACLFIDSNRVEEDDCNKSL